MALVNSSWMRHAIGRHDLALELLYGAMRPTPDYARAYVNRAEVHEATGNLARVLTDLQKAERLVSAASDNRQEDPWRPAGNARQSSQHKRTRDAA